MTNLPAWLILSFTIDIIAGILSAIVVIAACMRSAQCSEVDDSWEDMGWEAAENRTENAAGVSE